MRTLWSRRVGVPRLKIASELGIAVPCARLARGAVRTARERSGVLPMARKLFVGGLSWNTTQESLMQAFSQFGTVLEAKVITDRETGRSRGFGFVTFRDEASAAQAVAKLDGSQLDGRTIRVSEAHDKEGRGGRFGGGSSQGRY